MAQLAGQRARLRKAPVAALRRLAKIAAQTAILPHVALLRLPPFVFSALMHRPFDRVRTVKPSLKLNSALKHPGLWLLVRHPASPPPLGDVLVEIDGVIKHVIHSFRLRRSPVGNIRVKVRSSSRFPVVLDHVRVPAEGPTKIGYFRDVPIFHRAVFLVVTQPVHWRFLQARLHGFFKTRGFPERPAFVRNLVMVRKRVRAELLFLHLVRRLVLFRFKVERAHHRRRE